MTEINAALFLKAADELERRGLNKHGLVDQESYREDPTNCKVCFWGAINAAAHGDPKFVHDGDEFDLKIMETVRPFVAKWPSLRPGVAFNDDPDTTQEDVASKLREIAASLT
jgi:hypothetical protein